MVLPNRRADQCGTVGNRRLIRAVGVVGRYAHVGQLDKITVAGLEAGEFKVSCFAAAGKSQLEVFGSFCLQVRIGFKVEVRMRKQEPGFVRSRRAKASAVFCQKIQMRCEFPV